jgi:hypothetical protein
MPARDLVGHNLPWGFLANVQRRDGILWTLDIKGFIRVDDPRARGSIYSHHNAIVELKPAGRDSAGHRMLDLRFPQRPEVVLRFTQDGDHVPILGPLGGMYGDDDDEAHALRLSDALLGGGLDGLYAEMETLFPELH